MNHRQMVCWFAGLVVALAWVTSAGAASSSWKAGLAKVTITPERPMWMAGYGSRTSPSEGKLHEIWAKALVLEDPEGTRAVLVTLDLCGIDREFSLMVRQEIRNQYKIPIERVVLSSSHTHTGPVVGTNLLTMYPLDDEQKNLVRQYTELLGGMIVGVVGEAIKDLSEAKLGWGQGKADFAVNRRENDQNQADLLRKQIDLKGPVDHDVPVLQINGADGKLRGVVFGYACHCTTLAVNQFSGDYAGYAMIALEKAHPEATALFVAGCGADQNPLPRRSVELAESYGRQLARAVNGVLDDKLRPVLGPLKATYQEIDLAFGEIPDAEHWKTEAESETLAVANRAKMLLEKIESAGPLDRTYPYPVQVWQLGDALTWIFLGGEVVVDYSLRLKRNLGGSKTWVAGYCNDVMAYIPSLRVLREGGYEGERAMIYYGLPGPWSEDVEEHIIGAIREQIHTKD